MEKTLLPLLRDPIWQSIGVIISLIFTWWLGQKQSQRKSLSYKVINRVNILNVAAEFKDKLEVLFESKPIEKPSIVFIKFINTGNISIIPKDYYKPIGIEFGKEAIVLTYEVLDQEPSNLDISFNNTQLNLSGHWVSIEPVLLNVNDSFTIKVLVSRLEDIKIYGRIDGIKKITEFEKVVRLHLIFSLTVNSIYFFASLWIFTISFVNREIGTTLIQITGIKDYSVLLDAANGLLIIGVIIVILSVRNFILLLKALLSKPKSFR